MKILLGPAGTPTITKGGTLEAIDDLIKLKLQAMEVQFTYGVRMDLKLAERVGERARNKISLTAHAPYYVNLCSMEKEKLHASKQRIIESAMRAEKMFARIVTFHPGFYGGLENAIDVVKDSCQDILFSMRERKIKNVFLGLETTGKKSQFGTLDEIIEICKKLKNCVPVVDFAHIYARNNGKIDYGEIFDKLKKLKLEHIHTHYTSVAYGSKGEKHHLTGLSKPNFEELAKEIVERKLDITIISESPVLEQESIKMKRVFEKLGYDFGVD